LSRSSGHVTHVLLTRSRLCPRPKPGSSLHLHVLSTPPAFVLSQDQTLRERLACHPARASAPAPLSSQESCRVRTAPAPRVHLRAPRTRRVWLQPSTRRRRVEPGRDPEPCGSRSHMLLSFQRPARPPGGNSARTAPPGREKGLPEEAHGSGSACRGGLCLAGLPVGLLHRGTAEYSAGRGARTARPGLSSGGSEALEAAFAHLEHGTVQAARGDLEVAVVERLAIELHPALG
jgi:hypothetical protein